MARRNKTQRLALAAILAALCALSARLAFPLPGTAVFFTPQLFFVLLSGLLLGARWAVMSQLAYLLFGLAGLPVFSKGGGVFYVFDPSFGYLLGFVAAAAVTGWLASRTHPVLAALVGALSLYGVALPYVAFMLRVNAKTLPSMHGFLTGYCLVFLPMDLIKAVLAGCSFLLIGKRVRWIGSTGTRT